MPDIQHFVVLMLENRSFDHLFGFRNNVNGLTGNETNLLNPAQPQSGANPAFPVGNGQPFAVGAGQGPSHSLKGVNIQIFSDPKGPNNGAAAANQGFVKDYVSSLFQDGIRQPTNDQIGIVMQSLSPDKVPAFTALANAFGVCDNWYCEVPGPTMPNRMYMHMATSGGFAHNVWDHPFDFDTIYNRLQDGGKSWAVYDHDQNEVRQCTKANAIATADSFRDFVSRFAQDCASGALPNYSFIIPRFFAKDGPVNSMHGPFDVRPADKLVADVYNALRANDAIWQKCVLIVTTDEHGGFYDHVIPPSDGVPNPDKINSPPPGDNASFVPPFQFDRLGLRVPTLLVSPWIAQGTIHKRLQHTSVLATVKLLYGLGDFLTNRDASAATFEDQFQATPRTDTPQSINVPQDDIGEAGANEAELPLDSLQQEMLIGIDSLTEDASPPSLMTSSILTLPATQREAAEFIRARLDAKFGRRG
ncbi:MAG TPA: alkaline phosphatase family protein [Chthonomonadaceae bacterium]|nr:alkaline phosphatase family protein [Chthonomonadaceae bacterium]